MRFVKAIALSSLFTSVFAAFGLTENETDLLIDTDAGLTWTIKKANGNIVSMRYNETEFQSSAKFSHINSGFGNPAPIVTAETIGTDYVKVKIAAQNSTIPVTHYYVAKRGDNVIYMATENTNVVDPGELRMLFRLDRTAVPNGYTVDGVPVSQITGGTAIEGTDVYLVNGTTRSKFYSSERYIEDQVHGVTGPTAGLWMVMPGTAYESSAGGPFMRDINMQQSDQHELYWYMNSGHLRTEPWRFGFHGPYALVFNSGTKPSGNLDTSFFEGLGFNNYVPLSQRGFVKGVATGVPSNFETVLHWNNTQAQYWTKAVDGKYISPAMKPGTYTYRMYRNEYVLESGTVVITAGQTAVSDITHTPPVRNVLWKIGEFDGQPFELKNGNKFLRMHPSDTRMSLWGGNFTVGTNATSDFPMAIFKDAAAGGKVGIEFYLTADQIADCTLRISTTLSFESGRPAITIPDFAYKPSAPTAPVKIESRGVTRGGYRGYGNEYTFGIARGRLVAGLNRVFVEAASGTGGLGYLSPSFIMDAIQFECPFPPAPTTTTTTTAPVTTSTINPAATTTTTTVPTVTVTNTVTLPAVTVPTTITQTRTETTTETLPAVSITTTETVTTTETLSETITLPAVSITTTETSTSTTTTTVSETITLPEVTTTTTLPAVTETVTSTATVTPSPVVCAHKFEQCGGIGWTGPTCCYPGAKCQVASPHYSQCKP